MKYPLDTIYDLLWTYSEFIPKIRELINKYNLDIPVVDLQYGYELPTAEQQKKRIRKLKNQYDRIMKETNN